MLRRTRHIQLPLQPQPNRQSSCVRTVSINDTNCTTRNEDT
jgi:hypothetical protein